MRIIGYLRGNKVYYNEDKQCWTDEAGIEVDSNQLVCPSCNKRALEGYDPCVGKIDGATGYCCGHGVHPSYTSWPGVGAPYGWLFGAWVGPNVLDEFYKNIKEGT